jgi:hypothetical protein
MTIRKMHPLITPDRAPDVEPAVAHEISAPAPYLDPAAVLDGWPGHRTMPDKLGLDPLENNYEAAHMAGVFIRYLFTGMPHAPGTIYLLLVPLLGVLLLAPFVLSLYMAWTGDPTPLAGWMYTLPMAVLGAVLLVRFGLSLWPRTK